MTAVLSWIVFLCLQPYLLHTTAAQQFSFYQYPYDTHNVSTGCLQALNTTVDCDQILYFSVGDFTGIPDILSQETLETLCVDSCRASLQSLRTTILSKCTSPQDTFVRDTYAYPPTFFVDRYLLAYDISCYKDKDTGVLCDLMLGDWRNNTNSSGTHDCEDCLLGPWSMQLESPLEYETGFAQDFATTTSSCGATGYSYTTPPAYGSSLSVSTTSSISTTSLPCATPYTVASGDTCESIAASQNVSSYGVIAQNDLDIFCKTLPDEGKAICLPPPCPIHRLLHHHTCSWLQLEYGVTRVQLVSWNANLDPDCYNIYRWTNSTICVGPPGTITTPSPLPEPTVAPVPSNAAPGSNTRCASWYEVVLGDYCAKIALDSSISLDDFYFLNPTLDKECLNLQLEVSYCVAPVGDITTYPGYTIGVPSTSFTRPPSSTYEVVVPTETLNPHAPGTWDNCTQYENYVDPQPYEDEFGTVPWPEELNSCSTFAGEYEVGVDQIVSWNPSLSSENCQFQAGYSYCVQTYKPGTTGTSITGTSATQTSTSTTSETSAAPAPTPTQPGTIETCKKFHLHTADDGACDGIIKLYGLNRDDFFKWNPQVGENCYNLWLGYYVCVGV